MVAVHAATLTAAPLESRWRARRRASRARGSAVVRGAALAALAGATLLRIAALRALGESWSTRVTRFRDGGRRVVTRGPYRWIRHPNYVAVVVELAALPLAGGAWLTALAATVANGLVLARRIPLEERELLRDPAWRAHFASLPRFVPELARARRPELARARRPELARARRPELARARRPELARARRPSGIARAPSEERS